MSTLAPAALAPLRSRWGRTGLTVGLAVALLVAVVVATGLGSTAIPPVRVLLALLGLGDDTDRIIVVGLRLPRVLLAVEAGVCLALAGALLQAATRNPLAAPSILGIVDGAALGVVAFLAIFSDAENRLLVSIHWQPLATVIGAFGFAGLVAALAGMHRANPLSMILYGVALAALAKSAVSILMIVGPIYRASQALIWLSGSVHEAHWTDVAIVGAAIAVLVPVLALLPRLIDQFALDDTSAQSTGLPVPRVRVGMLLLAVVLTAAAVSFVGGIAFVGLIAPHAARLLFGASAGARLIASALIGAIFVVLADLLGRVAFAPLEVPTGAITALVGAPYFLWLLVSRGRAHA